MPTTPSPSPLRHPPTQARSRDRLRRLLDAADDLLHEVGAEGFTTTAVAARAGIPVGSVYRFFTDKEAIAEALALRHWSELAALVDAAAASADEAHDAVEVMLGALADGLRARPGFLALWYGGLRTERVRDATRPVRREFTATIARLLDARWPGAEPEARARAAEMVVLTGDGLLREAFRRERTGDPVLLAESALMLSVYLAARLGREG